LLSKQNMNISELWIKHCQELFPKGYGGKDVNGICVTSVDTNAAGCISSYMGYDQKNINLERYQVLQKCKKELEEVLPHLENEALEYFSRLHEMCSILVTEASIV